jgi:hypothetical protein
MAMQKTSRARIITIRLNPINATEDAALTILDRCRTEGYQAKQVIVDRLLRVEGIMPEMFERSQDHQSNAIADVIVSRMDGMLEAFAEHLLDELRKSGASLPASAIKEPGKPLSPFAKNLVKGYQARQAQGGIDSDVEYVDLDE